MNRRNLTVVLSTAAALAAFVLAAIPARAATSTGTVTVKASVAAKCIIGNATLDFGAYDPTVAAGSPSLDQTTTITVNCTKSTPWVVGMSQGANGPATRNMKDAVSGDVIRYELYTDAGHTNVWSNNAVAGLTVASGTGTGAAAGQPVTIFGRITANQYVTPGSYTDSVTATVNF